MRAWFRYSSVAGALVAALAVSAGAHAASKITIMVGGIDKIIYLPPKLTENLGYFKDEGLDVELQSQQAGVNAENQLVAGAVEAVVGYYDHSIDLQSKGKEIKSIVQFGLVPGAMMMVRSDEAGTIKSFADIKGKTIGVTGLGSSSSFLAQYLALKGGHPSGDYTMLPVGAGSTLIAAMKQKRIDVAWTTEPTTSQLLSTGEAKPIVDLVTADGTRQALDGLYPAASLYVRSDWAASHKDEAAKLAKAFVRTLHFIQTHTPEEIADKMPTDYYGGNKALYVQAMKASIPMFSPDGRMPQGGPETALKVLQAFSPNLKGKTIDLSRTYTNEFVDQVK
ncbi:nitrate ABC transporter substrate-binding protein [Bordetella genomosp. 10]|uniref:Nitrate ABC transporter substrate-binding protein n=1 Tax=Bordetella genomosp. 10 TaxID=1416804 RepID=A0A261S041_9BORD|nr:ABC transporter substrate-binding protein [Bordetella genomosp. 10]OZI29893.1 nitrate ABC transporter substrate-binding protein [Bordetella genomosp. 10]